MSIEEDQSYTSLPVEAIASRIEEVGRRRGVFIWVFALVRESSLKLRSCSLEHHSKDTERPKEQPQGRVGGLYKDKC